MEPRICFIGTIFATFAIIFMAVIGWEKYEPVPCVEHSTGTFMLHKKQATFRQVKFSPIFEQFLNTELYKFYFKHIHWCTAIRPSRFAPQ